jgi:hypothetical protein
MEESNADIIEGHFNVARLCLGSGPVPFNRPHRPGHPWHRAIDLRYFTGLQFFDFKVAPSFHLTRRKNMSVADETKRVLLDIYGRLPQDKAKEFMDKVRIRLKDLDTDPILGYGLLGAAIGANACRSVEIALGGKAIGNVTIPPNHDIPAIGQVVEIRYLYVTGIGGSLYQPVYLGQRDDIRAEECTVERQRIKFRSVEDLSAA